MANLVEFGLTNVHYAIFDEETNSYGKPKRIPGGVKLTTEVDESQTDFHADDMVYATLSVTSKESGTLEFAAVTEEMEKDLFGYEVDSTTGLRYRNLDKAKPSIALMYEVDSTAGKRRGSRYNVTLGSPTQEHNTKSDSTSPDTVTCSYNAIGRQFSVTVGESTVTKNVLKGHCKTGDAGYDTYFDAVVVPGEVAA
jgi:phi13 family phage major tail protein